MRAGLPRAGEQLFVCDGMSPGLARAEQQPILDVDRFAMAADGAEEDGGGVELQANAGMVVGRGVVAGGVAVAGGVVVTGVGAAVRNGAAAGEDSVCDAGNDGDVAAGGLAGGSVAASIADDVGLAGTCSESEGDAGAGNASGADNGNGSREEDVGDDDAAGRDTTAARGIRRLLPSSSCTYASDLVRPRHLWIHLIHITKPEVATVSPNKMVTVSTLS